MIRRLLTARPVAIGLTGAILAVAVTTGVLRSSAESDALRDHLGIDPELLAHGAVFPGLLTGLLLPGSPVQAVLSLVIVFVVTGAAERRMGRIRTLWVFLATGIVGTVVGILLEVAGLATRRIVTGPPLTLVVLDPTIPAAGLAFAASAFVGPLWRRRIRVLGTAALATAMLYSGGPADLYRISAAAVGAALGTLLTLDAPRRIISRGSHHEARSLVAVLVAITAIGPLVARSTPHGWGLLRPIGQLVRSTTPAGPGAERWCHVAHTAAECGREYAALGPGAPTQMMSVLPLLVLLLAAVGLWRGRRVAALTAVVVEVLFAVLGAVYFDLLPLLGGAMSSGGARSSTTVVQAVLAVVVPAVIAVTIVVERRHFTVRTSSTASRAAAGVAGGTVLIVSGAYLVAADLVRQQFSPRPNLYDLLWDLPERFVPIGFLRLRRADFVPVGPAAHELWAWTGLIAWSAVVIGLVLCLAAPRDRAASRDVARVRRLLRSGSVGPVAGMAVWPGNRYWFSDDGRHAIAYRAVGTVALTVGEPIGPEEGATEAAVAFSHVCDDRGLTPVFYTVRPAFATALERTAPWRTAPIGEDTVIDLRSFAMTGKRWSDVRSSINRAGRGGIRAEWTTWDECPLSRRVQIEAISEDWASERRLPEMTFTLGGLTELRDPDTRLLLAIDATGHIEAVTSWLPTWREDVVVGLTLDVMRRRTGGMNGVMEFLIGSAALDSQRDGIQFLSLSASPLAGAHTRSATATDRMLDRVARLLEPAYGFRSLASFKEKFQPEQRPLVMAFPDRIALPAIAMALLRTYLPDAAPRHVFTLLGAHRTTHTRRRRTMRPDRAPRVPR